MQIKTAQTLQKKYADILKDDRLIDCISVMHKFKGCNLLITKTRLLCVKDDMKGIECLFDLSLADIQRSFLSGTVITITPGNLKLAFTGLNHAENQIFFKRLPHAEKPPELTQKQGFLILGGGALVIALVAIAGIFAPRQYVPTAPEAFFVDCKAHLDAEYPDNTFTGGHPLPEGNKGVLTIYFKTPDSQYERYFSCYRENLNPEAKTVARTES